MMLSEMRQSLWKGVVYGPPGCGKTAFATISSLNTFVFDVDQGMNTTLSFRASLGVSMDRCAVWPVRTVADFDDARKWLVANMASFAGGLVVVDSATELARIVQKEVLKGKSLTPDQRQWGDVRVMMENQTVEFRYMPCNVVYTCHEVLKDDPDFGRPVYRPSFDGRFAFEYAKHFSWIARLSMQVVPSGNAMQDGSREMVAVRGLDFGPNPYAHWKDRSGSMPRFVSLPPDMPMLDPILQRMVQSTSG